MKPNVRSFLDELDKIAQEQEPEEMEPQLEVTKTSAWWSPNVARQAMTEVEAQLPRLQREIGALQTAPFLERLLGTKLRQQEERVLGLRTSLGERLGEAHYQGGARIGSRFRDVDEPLLREVSGLKKKVDSTSVPFVDDSIFKARVKAGLLGGAGLGLTGAGLAASALRRRNVARDKLDKIAEGQEDMPPSDAPTFGEFLRYNMGEPLLRVGLPAAAGVGLGYLGAGAMHQGLRKIPAVSEAFQRLNPEQQKNLMQLVGLAGAAGGSMGGAALGYYRSRVRDDAERKRMEAREEAE